MKIFKIFEDHCIQKFSTESFTSRNPNFMVCKRYLTCVLPYSGEISVDVRTTLRRSVERSLRNCKCKF